MLYITTPLDDLEVRVTDLEVLCLSLVNVFIGLYLLNK